MQVYQTNSEGVFVHATVADPDPMNDGNFLIPAGCVTVEPPSFGEESQARWDGSSWIIEDRPVEEEETPPEPEPLEPDVEARLKRDGLLLESDWTQLIDTPVDQDAWAAYRSLLRDVPDQDGFPDTIVWPTKPTGG